ncbi:MAG: MFS transporter [Gammaproteobacteria bacterium]|nr:MFS transporter [Gammaproteobacteria bacterium]
MLKETQFSTKGFIVWGVCVLFFLYEFFLRASLGTFQHPLMHDLHLSSIQYSLLSTTLFAVMYGVMQIPVGLLIDNIGLKKVLLIGGVICAFSSFAFAYSETYLFAVVARMFMGLGASVGFLCLLVSVHEWMPHRHNALFIGLSQFVGTMGPMFAAGPLEDLAASGHIPWQVIFKMLGIIGLGLVALIIAFVENSHERAEKYVVLKRPESTRVTLLKLFSRSQAWYIAIFSGSVYFAIEYLSENEGRIFLGLKGFSESFSSYMITIAWVGYAIGCPLLGFLSDYFKRRKSVLMGAAICSVVAILLVIFSERKSFLMIGFFLLGVAASGQSVGFAIIAEQFKKQFVPIGLALNNFMIMIFIATNAPTIAFIIDTAKSRPDFGLSNYYEAFSLLIVVSVIALLVSFLFIKETFCKSVVDFNCLNPRAGYIPPGRIDIGSGRIEEEHV